MLVYVEYISRRPGSRSRPFTSQPGEARVAGRTSTPTTSCSSTSAGRSAWARAGVRRRLVRRGRRAGAGRRVGAHLRLPARPTISRRRSAWLPGSTRRAATSPCWSPCGVATASTTASTSSSLRARAVTTLRRSSWSAEDRHDGLTLNLLCDRIGALGPDPRCLAVWTVPGWDALDEVVRELDGVDGPVRLVHGALYRDLGAETL